MKRNTWGWRGTAALVILTIAAAVGSRAALLVEENFDGYATGNINGQTATGTGLGGSWIESSSPPQIPVRVEAPGLTVNITGYSNLGNTNAQGLHSSSQWSYARAELSPALSTADGKTYYFSLLVNVSTRNDANRIRIFSNNQSGAGVGINFDTTMRATIGGSTSSTGIAYNANETYLVVGRIDFNSTTTLTLWRFADGSDITTVDWAGSGDLQFSASKPGTLHDYISLGRGGGETWWRMDAFRIGDTALDVIPEPSTALLMGFGVIAALARRCRVV